MPKSGETRQSGRSHEADSDCVQGSDRQGARMTKSPPGTLFDKIWASHLISQEADGTCIIYIDRHLVHEVTSPQAFEGLRIANRNVSRPEATIAAADHSVPTQGRRDGIEGISDPAARLQVETLERNCRSHGIDCF